MHAPRSENLFRQNAIDALGTRHDGRPVARMPRPWLWLAGLCTVFVLAAFCFALTTEYARKESVRGWLVAEPGVVSLAHGDYVTVASIARMAGERVRKGEPVLMLSEDVVTGDGPGSSHHVLQQLQRQLVAVERRELLLREQLAADRRALAEQIRGIDDEVAAVFRQRRVQGERVTRKQERLEALQTSRVRGAITKHELEQQQDSLDVLQQTVARLQQEADALRRERAELLAQQERLATEVERGIARLAAERSELRQRMVAFERRRALTLYSPIDGIVTTIDVVPGTTVRPQQQLASIIPAGAALVAEVYVPSRAAGMIERGQAVQLRYDAFPHEHFGAAHGVVEAVAGFVSLPGDLPGATGLREAAYKVRIRLAANDVEDENGRYALRPGMALAAEIVLERRSLMDWLLGPLLARL